MEGTERILLVEGPNDKQVIDALLKHYNLNLQFSVEPCGGIDNLIPKFDAYLKNPTAYPVIGVIVDADFHLEGRWQQIKERLNRSNKYSCAELPLEPTGMIVIPNDPEYDARVGIWIMPDNQYTGYLEDFLINMVAEDDKLMVKVEQTLNEIESEHIHRYRPIDRTKAKIHTYLSWQKKPGKSLNTAIMSHVLDADSPIAERFATWLDRLKERTPLHLKD